MLKADQAPYFETCPRCGVGGLETLKTHAFCVNCNYEEIYDDEFCVTPRWALDAIMEASKPKKKDPKIIEPPTSIALRKSNDAESDGSAA